MQPSEIDNMNRDRSGSSVGSEKTDAPEQLEHAHTKEAEDRQLQISGEDYAAINQRLNRKFDLHILPFLFGIWLFAFIDRSNIGNARIDGLAGDLHLTGNKFNIALVVFYVPYIIIDVPSNWIVKWVGAGMYLPAIMIAWGLVSTFLGFTKSFGGLVAARCFLGLFEGCLLPGIIVYLAMFYERHAMLWRIGLFYCAAPLSGAFGGLLATGLAKIKAGGYDSWPWIFFVEGAITVVFGAVAMFYLPNTPTQSRFLTEEEKRVANHRMQTDSHGAATNKDVDHEKFSWHWVKVAIFAPNTLFCSLAWFFLLVPLYSFSLFLPTIIRELGYSSTKAQAFTAPPNIVAFVLVLITAFFSDRIKARGPIMAAGCVVAIGGYIMLLASKSNGVRYGGTFLVASGVFVGSPMVMGWLSNNTAPHFKRATATGFQIAFANCSAFIATFTYLQQDAPDFVLGHSINLGSLVLCIITIACGVLYCRWENAKRERGERDYLLDAGDPSLLGDRHPHFRYTI